MEGEQRLQRAVDFDKDLGEDADYRAHVRESIPRGKLPAS